MMGWMKRILRLLGSTTSAPASWFVEWIRGVESDSGYSMESTNCLRYPPIWYAVNKIAGHLGVMPLILYRREGERGRQRATDHAAFRLLKQRPNDWLSAAAFKELLTQHALLWGNGRALITRTNGRVPLSLEPLDPRTRTVRIKNPNGQWEKWHRFDDPETGEQNTWPDANVLHVAGLGYNGVEGYSVVEFAKNSWGLGLAAERQQNRFIKNNAVPSIVLEAPPGVFRKKEEAEEFLARFNAYHAGSENAGRVGLLREGIKANQLSMSGRDAQFIEQRKFQRQEAALWMLLEQILGDDSSVSYNSLEQKNLAYLTNCLLRWLVKWEEECAAKLLTVQEQKADSHFWKFTTAALLRGSTKERYEVYSIGRQMRVLSANDVRELEDMNPIEGGDEYDNPNIDTNAAESDEPTTEPRQDAMAFLSYETPRLAQVIRAQLRDFVRMECHAVQEAADKQANFVEWLDRFYSTWVRRTANVFERCGDRGNHAEGYASESKSLLLEIAGLNAKEELAEAIRIELAAWPDRADKWTETILGEMRWQKS